MAKTIHLNKGGLPFCGTKAKTPKVAGNSEKGILPPEVNCKRCRKKAEKEGLSKPKMESDRNRTKPDQNQTTTGKKTPDFNILDMSEFDNDSGWVSINDEWPPISIDKIYTVDCLYQSVEEDLAIIARQHIYQDLDNLGFSRVTHWKYRK